MADRLRVLPHVVEAVLNHVSGHRAGVAATTTMHGMRMKRVLHYALGLTTSMRFWPPGAAAQTRARLAVNTLQVSCRKQQKVLIERVIKRRMICL